MNNELGGSKFKGQVTNCKWVHLQQFFDFLFASQERFEKGYTQNEKNYAAKGAESYLKKFGPIERGGGGGKKWQSSSLKVYMYQFTYESSFPFTFYFLASLLSRSQFLKHFYLEICKKGHRQTLQIMIRCHIMWCLIWLTRLSIKNRIKKYKITPETPVKW